MLAYILIYIAYLQLHVHLLKSVNIYLTAPFVGNCVDSDYKLLLTVYFSYNIRHGLSNHVRCDQK